MDDQNRNLILACVLSILVLIGWSVIFPPPETDPATQDGTTTVAQGETAPLPGDVPVTGNQEATTEAEDVALAASARIEIENPELRGSISVTGGRIDDLELLSYRQELAPESPNVRLLSPRGEPEAFYSTFGWVPSRRSPNLTSDDVPGINTPWSVEGGESARLTPETPVALTWSNDKGLTFRRTLSIDDQFLITVTQEVTNTGNETLLLAARNEVIREGMPSTLTRLLVHEGALRHSGEELLSLSFLGGFFQYDGFDELRGVEGWGPHADVVDVQQNGWLGFTDRYWMAILAPQADQPFKAAIQYLPTSQTYKAVATYPTIELAPGQTSAVTSRLFAGAKEWGTIRAYEREDSIYKFIDSTDWGWYFFLTKPFFGLLHWLNSVIGNMGWAIIALTLIVKALLFPLAYRSYVSMAKMKELQPEMEKIKERAGDDRQKLQQEMMGLYRKEKVNPASGCLPILLQIPIFFSLYKVILVSLELRHAPWFAWIKDLSAPDPSSLLNLWGILPFAGPEPGSIVALLFIGILPVCLGVSMWLQQKLNPSPTDPTQQMIFAWMPWVFMFMLGSFASGLVLYWIANNVITFTQQYIIMRSQGYKPDVFGNIRSSFKRKKADP